MTLRPARPLIAAACAAALLALAGCQTMPRGGDGERSYFSSCLTGAAVTGVIAAGVEIYRQRGRSAQEALSARKDRLIKAAAAGCAIGLAATAVGKLMDARQQSQHEEAMQRDAQQRALQQQQQASQEARIRAMPAGAARDAELERARRDWQAAYTKPVVTDLGGGTSTVQADAPRELPAAGQAAACVEYSVLVRTAAGSAKQYETWCPNAQGQMVRAEVRGEGQA